MPSAIRNGFRAETRTHPDHGWRCSLVDRGKKHVVAELPYSAGGLLDCLQREAAVLSTEYTETGVRVEAIVPPELFGRLKPYIPGFREVREDWE